PSMTRAGGAVCWPPDPTTASASISGARSRSVRDLPRSRRVLIGARSGAGLVGRRGWPFLRSRCPEPTCDEGLMRPNPDGIVFLELSSRAADFLHELSDPGV